jgi:hypothetical protein
LHTFIGNADNNLSYGANINTHSLSGNYAYETAPADLSLRGIKKPYTFYMDSGIKYLYHNRIFLGVFFGDTQSRPFGFNPTLSHMDIDSIPLNSTRDDGAITIFLCDE